MALIVARSAPSAIALAGAAGRTAGLTGAALGVAKDLAGLLWRHRDALGGVSRSIFQHLKESYFPTPPRGGKKKKGRGRLNITATNPMGAPMAAPVSMSMYFRNPSFTSVEMRDFEGMPGMRVTFRIILGTAISVFSDNVTGGYWTANRGCPFLVGAGVHSEMANGTSVMVSNDHNTNSGRYGRGTAVIIHPGLLNSRIQDFARMWCNYRFRHLSLGYVTESATSITGTYTTGFIATKEVSMDESERWIGNQIAQCPGSSIFPVWAPGLEAASFTYTGPEWYQCMVDVADDTINGYAWTTAGRDDFEETIQVVLAGSTTVGNQASTIDNINIASKGYWILDGVCEFAGVCPASWDTDRSPTSALRASGKTKNIHGVKQTR